MGRILALAYGTVAYGAFFLVFLYMIGFVGNMVVPKSIDSGVPIPVWQTLLVNFALVGLFALQHTVMARPAFKAWWTKIVPKAVERSTFVLVTSLILALLFWQWRPMPATVWDFQTPWAVAILTGLFFLGWAIVLYGSFIIDHFDLFGLRQVFLYFRNRTYVQANSSLRPTPARHDPRDVSYPSSPRRTHGTNGRTPSGDRQGNDGCSGDQACSAVA